MQHPIYRTPVITAPSRTDSTQLKWNRKDDFVQIVFYKLWLHADENRWSRRQFLDTLATEFTGAPTSWKDRELQYAFTNINKQCKARGLKVLTRPGSRSAQHCVDWDFVFKHFTVSESV
jgi:hypothetical protein